MEAPEIFADQLADAARSMQGWTSTQLTLEKVVLVATEIIRGCDLVGISIVHSDGIDTPVGTDETLNRIDELQFVLKEGPCFDALHLHEVVHSRDLANDQRWQTSASRAKVLPSGSCNQAIRPPPSRAVIPLGSCSNWS